MNHKHMTDTERVTLDACRTLNRAEDALLAAKHLKRFAKLTKGNLEDVHLQTETLKALDKAIDALSEAGNYAWAARLYFRQYVRNMKMEEAN